MMQIGAIFLDAYRELNARKMFWITLILSGLAMSVLLVIGISPDHKVKFAWWQLPIPLPPSVTLAELLKGIYVSFGISFWLTWAATILALISTASIFPDFMSSGSIDLVLAKPIGRLRLFLLKYLSGLLFVGLQVTVFSLAAFLIIGLRAGQWQTGLFIAVPLVVTFFSYLFSVCALVGTVTRSTISSLLLTLLFWLLIFLTNVADGFLMMPRVMNDLYVERLEQKLAAATPETGVENPRTTGLEAELNEAKADRTLWHKWHGMIVTVKTVLPKTGETIKLLERRLIKSADLPEDIDEDNTRQQLPFMNPKMRAAGVRNSEVIQRVDQTYRNRPVWWIVGTSLLFEAAVVAVAAWKFCRRDF